MPRTAEPHDLYAALDRSARLMEVDCSPDRVQPVLEAYADVLPQAVIAFRVATNARHEGEFDCRFTVPKGTDPYQRALANSLTATSGHPVDSLLAEIADRCPIDSYGVDFGVVGGFRKIWVYFPKDDFQTLATLAELPSMPKSLAGNRGLLTDYGLDERVDVIGIDYRSKTVNLYFTGFPDESRSPAAVLRMHREAGLPEPSSQMLEFCENAFGVYTTLNWSSSEIERIAFGVKTRDPLSVSARLGPKIENFAKTFPYGTEDPKMVYAAMTSDGEEYYKLQLYYRFQPRSRLNVMPSADGRKTYTKHLDSV